MQLCMIACSLVHIACARSTNIDPSAAGALRGNFSQPTQECCLGAPEAAHPLLAGSRLYSACEPNGWATFNLLVLAPDHLNRDGEGNKEVTGLSSGSDDGRYFDHAASPSDNLVAESSINKTGKRSPAAAADCLGLTMQDMWKLAGLELVGCNLKVLLKQPWLIGCLVVVCYLGAQALARARDARKPGDGRNRCAQRRASAASPRQQKTSLPRLGGAAAPLRPMLVLCHLTARSAAVSAPPSPPPPSYIFADKASLRGAVALYNADAASATARYGPISSWNVSAVTNMNHLFWTFNQFNADISSWDTSSVTDMREMFRVRSAGALPSASTVEATLLLAPPTTPPHPPACLPARRPSSYASPFYLAVCARVQPAAELRHVQRHRHELHA